MTGFEPHDPLLPEIFALHGRWRSHKEAVICGEDRLTWSEFDHRCNQVANALSGLGLMPGDTIGILMSNSIAMVETLFGVMKAGLVSVPINLSVSENAIESMFKDSNIKALFATEDQAARLSLIRGLPEHLIVTGPAKGIGLSYDELISTQPTTPPDVVVKAEHILNIIYSSGTTGMPKGIVQTHKARRDWALDLSNALRYHGAARTLITIGLYSNISWVALLCTLIGGGTIIVAEKFSPDGFLNIVAAEKITHTAMVPIQYQRVVEQMGHQDYDVSTMQAMMACGAPLHEEVKSQIFDLFPCGIIELYGLTEGIITTLDPEDVEGRLKSVGKPLLGTDIKILDEKDQECAPGLSGEIVSYGRITMREYLNRPEETNEASWVDDRGRKWIRTGDIGFCDDEGFIYIVDRKKDMILSGGQNIYPQDIEAVIIQHDNIQDVAVIGAKSTRWDETPIALVVADKDIEYDQKSILDWSNEKLGKQQRIRDLIFVEDLPRNPNGKILKGELRKIYGQKIYD